METRPARTRRRMRMPLAASPAPLKHHLLVDWFQRLEPPISNSDHFVQSTTIIRGDSNEIPLRMPQTRPIAEV